MSWAQPAWLWALTAAPLLALVLAVAGWWHRRKLRKVLSPTMVEHVLPRGVRVRRTLRDLAAVLGLAALVVALAEPRFDKQVRTLQSRGTDVVLLLDLSRSMDARDVDPSRLERARREIADLARVIEGDRVGLVVFAGGAYPRLPLTADLKALQLVVSEASTDTFDTQGSNLAAAIRVGMELLDRSQEHAGQALLVLSDGETHAPEEALEAARAAGEAKVPIFVLAIGDGPAPVPLPDGRTLQWKGQPVTTEPDFDILKQVAKSTGGAFVKSTAGSSDVEQLYTEIRRSVRAVERTTQQREQWRSAFQVPLGFGVALLLGAAWLGEGRRSLVAKPPPPPAGRDLARARTFAAWLAVGLALASSPAFAEDPLLEADRLYRDGKFAVAAEKLVELSLEQPDDADVFRRLGSARYRAGDYEGAARAWGRASEIDGTDTESLYNGGNAAYLAGRLEDAKARYEAVLERAPDDAAAKQNHDLVVQEIEKRRTQPPPPPPQQGDGEDQQQGSGDQDPQQKPQPQKGAKGGDPKPGDPQVGDAEPEPGEPGKEAKGSERRDSKAPPDPSGTSQAVDPSQVAEDPSDDPSSAAAAETDANGEPAGPITAGQAHRLLDSVEEGSQRMVVQGRPEQEPW